jgi:hypothetical protein
MTNDQMLILLKAIKDLAIMPYPFEDNTPRDERLIWALGEIGGLASKAVSLYERSR